MTASIQDDVRAWQSRPLEELYVVVYLDALQVAIRDQQVVRKKAVYVAIGVTLEGSATASASGSKRARAPASGRAS